MFGLLKKTEMPAPENALQGRAAAIPTDEAHYVNGRPLKGPYPEGMERVQVGMGCFWGVERKFWMLEGVWVTAAGYGAGYTPNPTYEEVCSGQTGHNELVLVVFDPARLSFGTLLQAFWEGHDPTQGMRQGNDVGTQYRSGLYVTSESQRAQAEAGREAYGAALGAQGFPAITTEIREAGSFYFAEGYHQQYLAKNPEGYCGLGGTGVRCSSG